MRIKKNEQEKERKTMAIGKEMKVTAIEEGTVIDHIPAGSLFKVIKILGLNQLDDQITFGTNLTSGRLGKKAIVKVSGKFFLPEEINRIALVAPHASLNIIRGYEVVEKQDVSLPKEVQGIVRCVNPKCITNHDEITPRFDVLHGDPVTLRCHYCERITDESHMTFIE